MPALGLQPTKAVLPSSAPPIGRQRLASDRRLDPTKAGKYRLFSEVKNLRQLASSPVRVASPLGLRQERRMRALAAQLGNFSPGPDGPNLCGRLQLSARCLQCCSWETPSAKIGNPTSSQIRLQAPRWLSQRSMAAISTGRNPALG
jgi:hypothetical protein